MRIQTKYFGELQFEEQEVLTFPDGLFGFEGEKQFLLLPFSEEADFLLCLQSVTTPYLAFTLLNPFMLFPAYCPRPAREELDKLGVEQCEDLCYYVLCRVEKPVSNSMVNLKCPIVINDQTRQARQVILDEYDMRCPLAALGKKDAETC